MAVQIPKTKSKAQVLQLKHPRLCLKTLTVGLCVLVASICSVLAATCPSSVPSSTTITSEQCIYSEYNSAERCGIAGGPVSSSLYFLFRLYTTSFSATIRKVDTSGSQTWMASFAFNPVLKSLSVDAAEQSVYLVMISNPIIVLKLAASDGSIVTQHQL